MKIFKDIQDRKGELINKLIYSEEKSSFRWVAVWEAIFFMAIVVLIDAAFFDGTRFVNSGFHPFWFVIILASTLYGLTEGLVIAIIATIFIYVGNMPLQKITENQYEYFLRIVFNPILWLLFVFFVGGLRDREIGKIISLKKQVADSDAKSQEISSQYMKVASINTILESKLATNSQTIVTVYNAIKNMETSSFSAIMQGVTDLIHTIISPDKFSVFLLKDNQLKMQYAQGWSEQDSFDTTYTSSSDLYKEIIINHHILCINNPKDVDILDKSIIAAPIVHDLTGEVFGMIKIEALPFSDLRQQNINVLMVIGRWLANALYQQKVMDDAKSQSIEDPELNVMSSTFYEKMVSFLELLGERTKFPVSSISLSIGTEELSHQENIEFSSILSDTVKQFLRATDLLFVSPSDNLSYAILLPNTNLDGAKIVLDKMLTVLQQKTHHHNLVKHSIKAIYETKE